METNALEMLDRHGYLYVMAHDPRYEPGYFVRIVGASPATRYPLPPEIELLYAYGKSFNMAAGNVLKIVETLRTPKRRRG